MAEVRSVALRLRRAVVELLVIATGVLIALGVDEIRQNLRDRATEAEYMVRLVSDLHRDVDALDEEIGRLSQKAETLQGLQNLVGDGPADSDNGAELSRAIAFVSRATWSSTPTQRATFDELLSTGSLQLFQSAELRNAISAYYQSYEWWSERIAQRKTRLGLLSYELVPRAEGTDFRATELSATQRERLHQVVFSADFMALLTAELNRTQYQILASKLRREEAEELIQILNGVSG